MVKYFCDICKKQFDPNEPIEIAIDVDEGYILIDLKASNIRYSMGGVTIDDNTDVCNDCIIKAINEKV